ncbi:uncharacterized protein LOC111085841 [Limulus polyphemus]|uniref:Uncharacterized protein LOC111085841 n=1 Tax=Limulus polyphemus TaxID=6850 RepID=A0ABM1SEA5_LIMPO|nr:uncharacterized protein LOC111085841 [Limulus polyphemus]XP_022241960.1 uncharacterized protein LOC111085841 [Limulus polyphemus]XP_022241961.1 uncharacterized protein LOC111085841 [Limulus polyphemus]
MMTDSAQSSVVTTSSGGSLFIVSDGNMANSTLLHTPQSSRDDNCEVNQDVSNSTSSEQDDTVIDSQPVHDQISPSEVELTGRENSFIRGRNSDSFSVERKTVLSSHGRISTIPEKNQDSGISGCVEEKTCTPPNSALYLHEDLKPSDLSMAKEHMTKHGGFAKKTNFSLAVPSNSSGLHVEHEVDPTSAAGLQLSDSHVMPPSNRVSSKNIQFIRDHTPTLSNLQSQGSYEVSGFIGVPSSAYSNGSKFQRLPPVSTIMQPRLASLVKGGFKIPSLESTHIASFVDLPRTSVTSSIDLSNAHDLQSSEAVCLSTISRPEEHIMVNPISLVANKSEAEGNFFGESVDSFQSGSTSLSEAGVVYSASASRGMSHSAPVIMSLPDFSKIHGGNLLISSIKDHVGHISSSVNKFARASHRGPLFLDDDGHPIVLPSTSPLLTPLDLGTATLSMVTSRISTQTAGKGIGQMNTSPSYNKIACSRPTLGVPTGVITAVGSSHSITPAASYVTTGVQEHPSLITQVENVHMSNTSPKNGSVLDGQDLSGVLGRSESEDDDADISEASNITTSSALDNISTSALPSILSSLASQSSYLLSSLVSSTSSSPLTLAKTALSSIPTTAGVPLIHGMQPSLAGSHIPYVSPFLLSGILPTSLSGSSVKQEPQEGTAVSAVTSTNSLSTLPSLVSILKQEAPLTGNINDSGPLPPFTVVSGLSSLSKRGLAGFDSAQVNFPSSVSHFGEISVKEEPTDNVETSPSESLSASQSPVLQNTSNISEISRLTTEPLAMISTNVQRNLSSPAMTHTTIVPSSNITSGFGCTATATSRTTPTNVVEMASTSLIGVSSGRKAIIVDKNVCQICRAGKPCNLHHSQPRSVSHQLVSGPLLSGDPTKPFQCNLCGKHLASKNVYQLHMRSHSGEKPFTCNLCGHHFSQKTSLTRHMRSHTGERPFPCEVCGKRFADKERTKIHMRTHTGEKPFSCEICGKCFSQKSTVKRHMSVHTGEKPFTCETCGKGFANRGNLNAHSKTHANSVNT